MSDPALDKTQLLDALQALRDARDPSRPEMGWAWRVVNGWMDTRYRRPPREHDDVRQRALIKVMRGVGRMQADTPAGGEAWLRRVHKSALLEHHRGHDPVSLGLSRERRDEDGRGAVDRLAAPDAERSEGDRRLLDATLAAVLERVDRWLAAHVRRPTKRVGDRRRAQCALMANVLGHEPDEIVETLGVEVSRSALYKWIERGREEVLIPALIAWSEDGEDPEGARLAGSIREILEGTRRSDAGKPRPARRSVSRSDGTSSPPSKRPKGPSRS